MTLNVRHESVGPADARPHVRIAHLSDLHLWFSDRKLRAVESILETWKPDLLVLTGDYADTSTGRRLATEWIESMAAVRPLCWIAGNHDRWWGRRFLVSLQSVQCAHAIDYRDAWLDGKDGRRFRVTTPDRLSASAKGEISEPTIVLLHDPAGIKEHELRTAENTLLLAGHLHGGQINLWGDRNGRRQPAAFMYRWLVDRASIGGATLIVSGGLGDTLPIRIRSPKEIVMIDWRT